jgi:hypothetical protein
MRDKAKKGRHHETKKTRCKWGHKLTGKNLRISVEGKRRCRYCDNARRRKDFEGYDKMIQQCEAGGQRPTRVANPVSGYQAGL